MVLRYVRYRLERFEEYREAFPLLRVAAVEHHHGAVLRVHVAVVVLRLAHLEDKNNKRFTES